MRRLLREELPHLIGTQEGLYQQLRDIQSDLPSSYDSIGQGRDGGSHGEAMQIFYDTRRLDPLEYDHYWLSDTPDATHFEAFDAEARRKSAELMLQRGAAEFDPALPIVATGDFNEPAGAGHTVFDLLVTNGPFVDSWEQAERRSKLFATFHGYQPLVPDGDRIDWILTSPTVRTRSASINTYSRNGQFPSDHLPVQAVLRLPG